VVDSLAGVVAPVGPATGAEDDGAVRVRAEAARTIPPHPGDHDEEEHR
jgi:hypothetical protein